MSDKSSLRVLIVEDSEDDAQLVLRELRHSGYAPDSERVETASAMRAALSAHTWDVILSDYMIPGFGGLEALKIARENGRDLPFILLSNKVSEETLVEAMRSGATDFLMKDRLERLGPAVKRELADAASRRGYRQAQIEWRTAFDAVQDAIFIHDVEFRVTRANLAYAALGGLPITQVIGKPYWEVFPRRDGPLPGSRRVVTEGGMAEERIDCADGKSFVSRSFAVSDASGTYPYCVNVMQDVTERNRVEEALDQSARHFRALLEHASDLVAVVDASGTITYISPSVIQIGGYAIDELLGKNYIEFAHPEDAPAAAAGYAEILRDPSVLRRTEFRFRRKDGTWTILESVARNALADPLINGIVMNSRDVTERKLAADALARKERYYRKLIEGGSDVFFLIDRAGNVRYRSESGKQMTGWDSAEVLGKQITDFVPAESLPLARGAVAQVLAHPEQTTRIELPIVRRDGTRVAVEVLGRNLLDDPDVSGIVITARDITERKRAQRQIEESEGKLKGIFEAVVDGIVVVDPQTLLLSITNSAFCEMLGYRLDEISGLRVSDLHPPESLANVLAQFERQKRGEIKTALELPVRRKDGSVFFADITSAPGIIGEKPQLVGVFHDVTERKRAEEKLRQIATELKEAQRVAQVGNWTLDPRTGDVTWSEEVYRIFGRDPLLPAPSYAEHPRILAPESYARLDAAIEETRQNERPFELDLELVRPDGMRKWITARGEARRDFNEPIVGLRGTALDITARKQAEEDLRRLNWALRALGQSNSALVHAETEKELFQACCEAIASTDGYPLAWIGLPRDDTARSIEITSAEGEASKYLDDFTVSWTDAPSGRGPSGTAIRTNATQVSNDLAENAAFGPWIERARAHGLASSIALPIRTNGSVMGVLVIYARETGAFGQSEVALFEELAADIGYGITARRTHTAYEAGVVEREQSTRKLRAAFESLIAVLAATVERRDPYTAGHQRRVAALASAIAATLGLEPARIEGLHFAATIHDIGKIYVPAEILARPGKLPQTEFELIKAHAQVGFEIVKNVEFPWQVADMIRQHHERLDGSGYPQGLKGDQILLESRILAVADMVEAMSSHRPYRPGLGMDAALAQIRQDAGTKLDAQVVDACERVFREQGFSFAAA